MLELDAVHWEMLLRGAVAGLLVFHLCHLAWPGPRPAARVALGAFTASVLAYLFCQQPALLLNMPRALAFVLLALCVGTAGWMWVAARALFDDGFRLSWPVLAAVAALIGLGLAANLPYFPAAHEPFVPHPPGSTIAVLNGLHGAAMLAFSAAALWEVARGWRADLVEARRAARRWAAMGIGLYAAAALAVELALRGEPVGRLLPDLHVAGIGILALTLALWVARHSLAELLGAPGGQATRAAAPAAVPAAALPAEAAAPRAREAEAVARLQTAMTRDRLYRKEGLSLADLARQLDMGETTLRGLINQRLGHRNFNDFLHQHRLNEALGRLANEDLPVLTIALECGYGSIGPFNRAFKQRMGMTPSEYRGASRLGGLPGTP